MQKILSALTLVQLQKKEYKEKKRLTDIKKLFIFGKPGAGKTTFLKHLAIECNRGKFRGDLVPFFITLKEFAEDENRSELLAYLKNYLTSDRDRLEQVLDNGEALILLDGLDEVLEVDTKRVIREINSLTNSYPNYQYL